LNYQNNDIEHSN